MLMKSPSSSNGQSEALLKPRLWVRVPPGAIKSGRTDPNIPLDQFLSMLRFEQREKLEDMGIQFSRNSVNISS